MNDKKEYPYKNVIEHIKKFNSYELKNEIIRTAIVLLKHHNDKIEDSNDKHYFKWLYYYNKCLTSYKDDRFFDAEHYSKLADGIKF